MIKRLIQSLFLLLLLIGLIVPSYAQNATFQVTIDRNQISLGTSAQLTLEFKGGGSPGALELPEVDGFQTQYLGPSTKVTIINGNYSKSTSYTYTLFPLKVGKYEFPSLKVEVGGKTYVSEPIPIEVVGSQAGTASSSYAQNSQGSNSSLNLEDRIFLEMGRNSR